MRFTIRRQVWFNLMRTHHCIYLAVLKLPDVNEFDSLHNVIDNGESQTCTKNTGMVAPFMYVGMMSPGSTRQYRLADRLLTLKTVKVFVISRYIRMLTRQPVTYISHMKN